MSSHFRSLAFLGFPAYQVRDDGTVWTHWRRRGFVCFLSPGWRKMRTHRLRPMPYAVVRLCAPGRSRDFGVHQLVLRAFVGPCPPGMQCRHLDGNPANNGLANLCWGTPAQNAADRMRHGTQARGERHGSVRLTEGQVVAIRRLYATGAYMLSQLGARYGIAENHVSEVVLGKAWRHAGGPVLYPRDCRGEGCPTAKLTEQDVRQIRRLRASGWALKRLADRFGVDQSNISLIALRKSWKHVA
jgi:hypothetical protein